jgi:hypothetical protein
VEERKQFAMSRSTKTYLLEYWSQKSLLDDDTRVFFDKRGGKGVILDIHGHKTPCP